MLIPRKIDLLKLKELLGQFPVTAILGPRQCGKTTLAGQLSVDHFFDLENPRDLARLENPQLALEELRGVIVIDEVQRSPELFPLLRYLTDTRLDQRYLILGSASRDLIRQSSESLAGRIAYYHLGGFRVDDGEIASSNSGCAAAFPDLFWPIRTEPASAGAKVLLARFWSGIFHSWVSAFRRARSGGFGPC